MGNNCGLSKDEGILISPSLISSTNLGSGHVGQQLQLKPSSPLTFFLWEDTEMLPLYVNPPVSFTIHKPLDPLTHPATGQ